MKSCFFWNVCGKNWFGSWRLIRCSESDKFAQGNILSFSKAFPTRLCFLLGECVHPGSGKLLLFFESRFSLSGLWLLCNSMAPPEYQTCYPWQFRPLTLSWIKFPILSNLIGFPLDYGNVWIYQYAVSLSSV